MSPLPPASYDNNVPLLDSSSSSVSASTVAMTAVATGHHMLKIKGYSRLKATHGSHYDTPVSYIESSAFKVGGHTWKIRCYLNGPKSKADNPGFVSLYLYLCSSHSAAAAVLAEYEFALLGHQPSDGVRERRSETTVFGGKDHCCWGFPRFISLKELERSGFLKDDCFAVRCTVTVVEERTVKEKAVKAHDMARMGMLCKCDDELCKRYHVRQDDETFLARFAKLCYFFCRGPVYRSC